MTATITLTMAAAVIYGSGRWLRGISDLVSLVHFGRSGGRDHNAPCFGTISWKERTLNDGSGHYPNDKIGHYLAAVITLTMTAVISGGRAGGIIMPHALVRFHGRNAP